MDIKGRTALVTGANRGIGAAIVDALKAGGAGRIYAAARRPETISADAVIVPVALDVTDRGQIFELAGRLDDVAILVNNAGTAALQSILAADAEAAEVEMRVNYLAQLAMCQAFASVLARNGGGAIVNILSILSRVSAPRLSTYSASKAAAYSMTQAVRAAVANSGTLVIGVMPPLVDTDLARNLPGEKLRPADVASAVVAAIRNGEEDVYPGVASAVAAQLLRDPKAVERAFAARG